MFIGHEQPPDQLIVDGQVVESVTKFNFIRALVTQDGGCMVEIRRRLAMAKAAVTKLERSGQSITRKRKPV